MNFFKSLCFVYSKSSTFNQPAITHPLPLVMLNLFQHLTLCTINFFQYPLLHHLLLTYLLLLFVLKQKGTEKIQGKSDGSARFAGPRTKTSHYCMESFTIFL
jgi:hypothetical protein